MIHYKAIERCKKVCKQNDVLFQGTYKNDETNEDLIVFADKKTRKQYRLEPWRFEERNIKDLLNQ